MAVLKRMEDSSQRTTSGETKYWDGGSGLHSEGTTCCQNSPCFSDINNGLKKLKVGTGEQVYEPTKDANDKPQHLNHNLQPMSSKTTTPFSDPEPASSPQSLLPPLTSASPQMNYFENSKSQFKSE